MFQDSWAAFESADPFTGSLDAGWGQIPVPPGAEGREEGPREDGPQAEGPAGEGPEGDGEHVAGLRALFGGSFDEGAKPIARAARRQGAPRRKGRSMEELERYRDRKQRRGKKYVGYPSKRMIAVPLRAGWDAGEPEKGKDDRRVYVRDERGQKIKPQQGFDREAFNQSKEKKKVARGLIKRGKKGKEKQVGKGKDKAYVTKYGLVWRGEVTIKADSPPIPYTGLDAMPFG